MSKLGVRIIWMVLLAQAAAGPAGAQEVTGEHDFRGSNFNQQLLRHAGADAATFVKPEDDGLHIRFKPGEVPKEPVGVAWRTPVIGNFVTTVRYELVLLETPKRGSGIGVELWLQLDNPTRDGIAFARQIHPKLGAGLALNHLSTNAEGKRYSKVSKAIPTTDASKRGRLRLARVGNEMIASSAEGDEEEFKEVARTTIDDVDVRVVRLAALPGGDPKATLDVRILDFELKGDLPGFDGVNVRSSKKIAGGAEAPAAVVPERGTRWILLGSLLLFLGLGFAFVAALLFVRLRKAAPKNVSTEIHAVKAMESKASFTCSACGQKIKVKESLLGKRVKCPACGQSVQIPANEPEA